MLNKLESLTLEPEFAIFNKKKNIFQDNKLSFGNKKFENLIHLDIVKLFHKNIKEEHQKKILNTFLSPTLKSVSADQKMIDSGMLDNLNLTHLWLNDFYTLSESLSKILKKIKVLITETASPLTIEKTSSFLNTLNINLEINNLYKESFYALLKERTFNELPKLKSLTIPSSFKLSKQLIKWFEKIDEIIIIHTDKYGIKRREIIKTDEYPFLKESLKQKEKHLLLQKSPIIRTIEVDKNIQYELNEITKAMSLYKGFDELCLKEVFSAIASNKESIRLSGVKLSIKNLKSLFKKIKESQFYLCPLFIKCPNSNYYSITEGDDSNLYLKSHGNKGFFIEFLKEQVNFDKNIQVFKYPKDLNKHDIGNKYNTFVKEYFESLDMKVMENFFQALHKYKKKKILYDTIKFPKEITNIIINYCDETPLFQYEKVIDAAVISQEKKPKYIPKQEKNTKTKNTPEKSSFLKKILLSEVVEFFRYLSGGYIGCFLKWQVKSKINHGHFQLNNKFSIFAALGLTEIAAQTIKNKSISKNTLCGIVSGLLPFENLLPEDIVKEIEPEFVTKTSRKKFMI